MPAVAVLGPALVAQQAQASPLADQLAEIGEFGLGLRGGELALIDPPQIVVEAGPRRMPAFGGRAQSAQVEIVDSGLGQAGGELALGEAGATRGMGAE